MSGTRLALSRLGHTWLVDVDGTALVHNGHLRGADTLLPGVAAFWAQIPDGDTIVLLSARREAEREATLAVFREAGLRVDAALFGLPKGERILLNDGKPGGLATALAVPVERDAGLGDIALEMRDDL